MIPVIDTHCHLNMVAEKGISVSEALANMSQANLEAAVLIAVDEATAREHLAICTTASPGASPRLYWTAGLHPEGADNISGIEELFAFARSNRDRPDFLGIGETGLDYYHTTEHVTNQKESFSRHLAIAAELAVPTVVHLRDSQKFEPGKIQSILDAESLIRQSGATGVIHCFTYGFEEAMRFVEMGWFISFSGIVTYKNADVIQDAAIRLPLDRILVETDAPFLTPGAVRGKPNQPAYVRHTLDFVAQIRSAKTGESTQQIANAILENSRRFLALKK
ncbi:MAG: TatD family hydrolase [Leptospirales bacterium]|nr:TatD family hydrolase [Leptospirales bacterium]